MNFGVVPPRPSGITFGCILWTHCWRLVARAKIREFVWIGDDFGVYFTTVGPFVKATGSREKIKR